MINKIKIQKNKHTQSLLKWIISNKQMSLSRKFYKLWVYQKLKFGQDLRKGNQCTLVFDCADFSNAPFDKLFRRTELLMRKGYIVRLELSLTEKEFSILNQEDCLVLDQLIDLLTKQKVLKYF